MPVSGSCIHVRMQLKALLLPWLHQMPWFSVISTFQRISNWVFSGGSWKGVYVSWQIPCWNTWEPWMPWRTSRSFARRPACSTRCNTPASSPSLASASTRSASPWSWPLWAASPPCCLKTPKVNAGAPPGRAHSPSCDTDKWSTTFKLLLDLLKGIFFQTRGSGRDGTALQLCLWEPCKNRCSGFSKLLWRSGYSISLQINKCISLQCFMGSAVLFPLQMSVWQSINSLIIICISVTVKWMTLIPR